MILASYQCKHTQTWERGTKSDSQLSAPASVCERRLTTSTRLLCAAQWVETRDWNVEANKKRSGAKMAQTYEEGKTPPNKARTNNKKPCILSNQHNFHCLPLFLSPVISTYGEAKEWNCAAVQQCLLCQSALFLYSSLSDLEKLLLLLPHTFLCLLLFCIIYSHFIFLHMVKYYRGQPFISK